MTEYWLGYKELKERIRTVEADKKKLIDSLDSVIAKSRSWIMRIETIEVEKPIHDSYRELADQALNEVTRE